MHPHESSSPRQLALLFVLLATLYLVPVWSVAHLPTVDGPSHLYNSWILAKLGDPTVYPSFAATFEVDRRPLPNWFSSLALLALFRVAAPLVAEKLLVSGYVLLLLSSFWYLAGAVSPERRWHAFLGFPFVYSLLFAMGFYNFCFSLAFYMLAIGLWWRQRRALSLGAACALNAILLLCYFSHVVSSVLALLSIAILWLCTLRRDAWRRHLAQVPLLAPQALLPLWFILRGGGRIERSGATLRALLGGLLRFDALWAFQPARWTTIALSLAFAAAAGRSAWVRWRGPRSKPFASPAAVDATQEHSAEGLQPEASSVGLMPKSAQAARAWHDENAFVLLAALLAAIYFLAPDGMAGGSDLKPRLSLYPFLALLPWLSLRLSRAAKTLALGALLLIAMANLGIAWSCFRTMDQRLSGYLRALDPLPRNASVLPLTWSHDGVCARAGIFVHALDYAALDKGLVDWNDYEAMTDYFPVRFQPTQDHPSNAVMEWSPDALDVERYSRRADYIVTWRMPAGAAIHRRIIALYDEIGAPGPLRLFSRREAAGAAPHALPTR